jgi:SAM-dependent methyltransferase
MTPPLTAPRAAAAPDVVFAHALRGEECHLVSPVHPPLPLPVHDWIRSPDAGDLALLDRCVGATIDVGCGPGRLTAELMARGMVVLGIDVVAEAVDQTVGRGGTALCRDVFGRVPGEGRWSTALLADGNIGIGGDPMALLTRVRELLEPGGRVVVELAPPGVPSRRWDAELWCSCSRTPSFGWAVVGTDDIGRQATTSGFTVLAVEHHAGSSRSTDRWWAVLRSDR